MKKLLIVFVLIFNLCAIKMDKFLLPEVKAVRDHVARLDGKPADKEANTLLSLAIWKISSQEVNGSLLLNGRVILYDLLSKGQFVHIEPLVKAVQIVYAALAGKYQDVHSYLGQQVILDCAYLHYLRGNRVDGLRCLQAVQVEHMKLVDQDRFERVVYFYLQDSHAPLKNVAARKLLEFRQHHNQFHLLVIDYAIILRDYSDFFYGDQNVDFLQELYSHAVDCVDSIHMPPKSIAHIYQMYIHYDGYQRELQGSYAFQQRWSELVARAQKFPEEGAERQLLRLYHVYGANSLRSERIETSIALFGDALGLIKRLKQRQEDAPVGDIHLFFSGLRRYAYAKQAVDKHPELAPKDEMWKKYFDMPMLVVMNSAFKDAQFLKLCDKVEADYWTMPD